MIAFDGKTLKRSYISSDDKMSALDSVTVWSKDNGLILAQARSKGKKNENKTVLEFIELLEIKNAMITADAINCQKKIADKIRSKQADYVLPIKENHKLFLEEIEDYFNWMKQSHPETTAQYTFTQTDSGHGRIETRRCIQLKIHELTPQASQWKDCATVTEITRIRELKNNTQTQIEYYIRSLATNLEQIADAIRSHWEVENKGYWVLDVVYKEDESRIRRENAAENIAVARRFALNLARLHPQNSCCR